MAIKVMANSGGTVTYNAEELGAAFNTFAGDSNYIVQDIGNEMSVSYSASSFEVTLNTGKAVVCGRPVTVTSDETVTLPGNSTYYLTLRVDLSKPAGAEGSLEYLLQNQIKSDNLNDINGQNDLVLGLIVTDSNGVSSFTDQRVIKSKIGTTSYNDLTDKPTIGNATLTIQRNGSNVDTFTANATSNKTINISVPTRTSDLTNNSGFVTSDTSIRGVNFGNVLATVNTSMYWTAPQDCFVRTYCPGKYGNGTIDNVGISRGENYANEGFIFCHSGSVIHKSSEGEWIVYGVSIW